MSTVKDVVSMGVDINVYEEIPAFVVAIKRGDKQIIDLFLSLGADPSIRSEKGESPLAATVLADDSSLVEYLLERGADPANSEAVENASTQNRQALGILFRAFCRRYPAGLPGFGGKALQHALQTSDDILLSFCLEAGFDTNSFVNSDEYGDETALGFVIRKYRETRLDLVTKILDAGGDINAIARVPAREKNYINSSAGPMKTAFLEAIETKSVALVKLLVGRGADVHKAARLGLRCTPLQKACEVGSFPIIRLLLEHGADVHGKPSFRRGGTALQLAAKVGSVRITKLLLSLGASIDAPPSPSLGHSAIEYAAKYGRPGIIEVLCKETDSSVTAEQFEGAISLAQKYGHVACIHLLRRFSSCHSPRFVNFAA